MSIEQQQQTEQLRVVNMVDTLWSLPLTSARYTFLFIPLMFSLHWEVLELCMLDRIELITCMPISLMDTRLFVSPPSPFRQRIETEIRHVEKDTEMGSVVVQMRDVLVVFVSLVRRRRRHGIVTAIKARGSQAWLELIVIGWMEEEEEDEEACWRMNVIHTLFTWRAWWTSCFSHFSIYSRVTWRFHS